MGIALKVENVAIRYITGDFKDIGLKEYVVRKLKNNYHVNEFFAVNDVSFELEEGDMLGIIGTNGAGKSTLLKAISGIMEPTRGNIIANGDVAALLELGSGFDEELTVRENAYLRGAMLGYTKEFMDKTYDQIIDFSELWDFQDRPFKQLSSGMKSRLAFSIASLVKPDVLILDEVLSVGDGAFQEKSAKKMREIISQGATTILVSHSLSQIRELCNKILWLDHGKQVAFGEMQEICDLYEKYLNGEIGLPQPEQKQICEVDTKNENAVPTKKKRLGKRAILACLLAALFFGGITGTAVKKLLPPLTQEACVASIAAKPDSGIVTFRGMSVDGTWYNPADCITSNDGWTENTEENTVTATGDGLLMIDIPQGKKQELVFDVGLDQGTAIVMIGDQTLEFTMTENTDWDLGWGYVLPAHSAEQNRIVFCAGVAAFAVLFALFALLCHRFGAKEVADLSGRELWGDLLRGFCSFVVVLLHCTCNTFDAFNGNVQAWFPRLLMNSFTAFAVPCFFMISGAYLLRKEQSVAATLKRRIPKAYIPLLIWGILYLLLRGNTDLSAYVRMLITNQEVHLWFMYSILQLYVLLPVISKAYSSLNFGGKIYALGILLVLPTAMHDMGALLGVSINIPAFSVMWPSLGLFWLGAILWEKREWLCKKWKLFAVLFVLGLALTVLLTQYITIRTGSANKTFFSCIGSTGVVLMAASALCLTMSMEPRLQKANTMLRSVVSISGSVGFGVYLTHIAIMEFANQNESISSFLFINRGNELQMILSAVVIYVLTSAVCWSGKKIPVINKIF